MAATLLDAGSNTATWYITSLPGYRLKQSDFALLPDGDLKSFLTSTYATDNELYASSAKARIYFTSVALSDFYNNTSVAGQIAPGPGNKPEVGFFSDAPNVIFKATLVHSVAA